MHRHYENPTGFGKMYFKAAALTAWAIGGAAAVTVGAQQYTASKQASAAKKQADHINSESARIEAENKAALAKAEKDKAGAAAQAKQSVIMRNRAKARSQTVFTSPLGSSTQASTVRKTLLGQ